MRRYPAAVPTIGMWLGGLFLVLGGNDAQAMPMFARKLGAPCSMCHTTIPRLNEIGFRYRAAGFRLPDEIGKPDTTKF